jgi:iron-sulfur cluster repair protein YtfE (RIC family)
MEATKLLKKQHDEVEKLFKRFESAEDSEEKEQLFAEVADNLAAHAKIEETIFYPAVYIGPLQEKLREAVEEHLGAKRVIADLLDMEPEDPQFDPKMKVLQEAIEHHVQEEERDLFPKVKKNFSAVELEALGSEMERLFDELKLTHPREAVPEEIARAAPLP